MARYQVAREDERCLIIDVKSDPARVICVCEGWDRWCHATVIVEALEKYNEEIYRFMPAEGDA